MSDKLIYERGTAERGTIDEQARDVWSTIQSNGDLAAAFDGSGIDVGDVGADFPFEIEEGDAGVVVSGTTIAIAILSPVAKDVLTDVWRKIILPRVQRRLGADAVGEERSGRKDKKDDEA